MKLSWIFVILLLIFVAVFSVQNAGVLTVHFLMYEIQASAALVIQLAALLGGLVGLAFGAWSRRTSPAVEKPFDKSPPAPELRSVPPEPGESVTTLALPAASSTRVERKPDRN